jgi:hypothetical protein
MRRTRAALAASIAASRSCLTFLPLQRAHTVPRISVRDPESPSTLPLALATAWGIGHHFRHEHGAHFALSGCARQTLTTWQMPTDLKSFGLTEMLRCSVALRQAARGASSMEDASRRVCRYLYEEFGAVSSAAGAAELIGGGDCALVRLYKTHSYSRLPASLRRFADKALGGVTAPPGLRCLTLLGTAGDEPEWNDRDTSRGHRAIPLPTRRIVEQAPMIAQLIRQFGLDLADIVAPSPEFVREMTGRSYGVFHVEDAVGSPFIPAQADFVERYGIRSVVGFGGALRSGDIFAVVLFSRVQISRDVAERFRTIALDVKSALFNFEENEVFSGKA